MRVAVILALAVAGTQGPGIRTQIAQENAALTAAVKAEGETKTTTALESDALRASNGRAWRDESGLHLKLRSGGDRLLQNHKDCPPTDNEFEQACIAYSLIADLKSRGVYVLAISYYEGGEYAIIDDQTGAETKVGAPLRFGPDPALFITIDNNEAYGDGSVSLWQRSGDRFRMIWHDQHGHNAAFLKEWSRLDQIKLRLEPISGELAANRSTATIVHDRTWHFLDPKP